MSTPRLIFEPRYYLIRPRAFRIWNDLLSSSDLSSETVLSLIYGAFVSAIGISKQVWEVYSCFPKIELEMNMFFFG